MRHRFFRPNLGQRGRWIRGVGALGLLAGGAFLLERNEGWGAILLVVGAFVLYEARRGWCLLRACGIRTKF